MLLHDTGPDHPDRRERIEIILKAIEEAPFRDQVEFFEAREATEEEIGKVHNPKYVTAMRRLCDADGMFLPSMDAAVGKESYPAALRAAGAGLTLADLIMERKIRWGFAPVRPPGHHASWARPWGFCIFNNMAILTRYLLDKYNLKRIGIFDFDIHHGNGTEQAFWTEPRVMYCSIHQTDYFPSDTGDWHDVGEGEGEGYTINIPMTSKSSDRDFLQAIDRYALPRFRKYKPQIMLVSAGFDGHWRDVFGGVKLTRKAFAGFADRVKKFAASDVHGRVITLLEGGYDLKGNVEGTISYLSKLMEEEEI